MRSLILALAMLLSPAALAQADDDYVQLIKRVQLALHLHGFDPGAVNGRDEGRTQAALAQFQLSRNLPASGSLDERTMQALGVSRDAPAQEEEENASAGAGMPLARP